jgi:hypothetical protein
MLAGRRAVCAFPFLQVPGAIPSRHSRLSTILVLSDQVSPAARKANRPRQARRLSSAKRPDPVHGGARHSWNDRATALTGKQDDFFHI